MKRSVLHRGKTIDTLVLALNRSQLDFWRSCPQFDEAGCVLLAEPIKEVVNDPQFVRLDSSSLLTNSDVERIYSNITGPASLWKSSFRRSIVYHGINVLDAFTSDLSYFFFYAQFSKLICERAIELGKPNRIILFKSHHAPQFWDPLGGPSADIFNSVAAWILERQNIEVVELQIPRLTPQVCQSQSLQFPEFSGRCLAVAWLHPYHLQARIRSFFELLKKDGSVCPVAIHPDGLEGPHLSFPALQNEMTLDTKHVDRIESARANFLTFRNSYQRELSFIFGNEYLDFQFHAQFDRMKEAARSIDAAEHIIRKYRPSLTLSEWDCDGFGKSRVRVAQRLGVHTTGISHGSLGPRIFQFEGNLLEVDTLFVEGPYYESGFKELLPHTCVVSIGAITSKELGQIVKLPKEILILTVGMNYGLSLPVADLQAYEHTWREIFDWMRSSPQEAFSIQPHPRYDYLDLFEGIGLPENCRLLKKVPLHRALEKARVVLLVDSVTSAAIDAMIIKIPLVYLKTAIFDTPSLRSSMDGNYPWVAKSVSEAQYLIDKISTELDFRKDILDQQADWLRAEVLDTDFNRTLERFQKYLRNLTGLKNRSSWSQIVRLMQRIGWPWELR